ncbi:gliding motility-associated ABC transporter substrate-binding protein GldG [Aquimarina agarilytica]|uniref:gliding motility-associated ABC transporter substrate-binding protein GldG n=1 Tax=Aquimarina agarilytica TaxID=1087449 RepID=UPI000288E4D4|nr:gliding motility-associated ABC transporter substrate-binding protein GldG [Aquimarina agarilytica]
MIAILKKELIHFFSSAIGYVFMTCFIGITGIFLWVLHGNFNIMDSGFASLSPFFEIAPWVFLLLIPAACMQSFADERKQGTLELLLTKPISTFQLILGKYLGICLIILFSVLPTLVYVIALHKLALPMGEIDYGSIIGSYVALLLLGAAYAAIGIFASSLTQNQTIALLISILLCFIAYFGIPNLAELTNLKSLDIVGIAFHYDRISQGVLDTRDLVYFIGFCSLFLGITYFIYRKKNQPINYKKSGLTLSVFMIIALLSNYSYYRFDLTQDKRFSLSETTKNLLYQIDKQVTIDILLDGKLPPEFKKLQRETKQLLSTFAAENKNIKFIFNDPFAKPELKAQNISELQRLGLTPAEVNTKFEGVLKKEVVVPWALAYFNNKSVKIPLLKNSLGATTSERITASVQNLEYAFSDALKQLVLPKTKKIAILKGNDQLADIYIADYIKALQKYYRVAPFKLDPIQTNVASTLKELQNFDLVINAKPTKEFTEKQKLVLDQHLMHGGNQLLLVDKVVAEKDSLFTNNANKTLAWNRDLHIKDMLFAYGVRINPQLINDYYSAPIILANGQGSNTQYIPYTWGYSSLSQNNNNHPITTNLGNVLFNFTSPIDTLKNKTKKTILLQSSNATKIQGIPFELKLSQITKEPKRESYVNGNQNLAVLLEGEIKSTYKSRILPVEIANFKSSSQTSKLIVISDGDIIKNAVAQQQPLELGFDPISKKSYANKDFLLNAANYLLDDSGLVTLRAKQVNIPVLNLDKVATNKNFWQWICLAIPILIVSIGYLLFFVYRKNKYGN